MRSVKLTLAGALGALVAAAVLVAVPPGSTVNAATTDIGFRRSAGEISETAFMGIYDCNGSRCTCADLASADGGADETYSWSNVSSFQKQDGWVDPVTNLGLAGISGGAPSTSAADINEMAWAMREYMDTNSAATAAALEHFIRVRTVGSPAQVARENDRWADTVANQPAAGTAFGTMSTLAAARRGPYTLPVTLNFTGPGAASGNARVVSAAGNGVPGISVSLSSGGNGTVSPAGGVTDATGRVNFSVSGATGVLTVSATATVAPSTVLLGIPSTNQINQRMLQRSPDREINGSDFVQVLSQPLGSTQISNQNPAVGETLTDTLFVEGLMPGVTATWRLQLFNLTEDPAGSNPLLTETISGLGNGAHPGLAPYRILHDGAGDLFGYRERLISTSDGVGLGPWSQLGIVNESGTSSGPDTAEVNLRKSVSNDDGATWTNAQVDATPAHDPAGAPEPPSAGSFNNQPADEGDGVPIYADGDLVSFQYEVWLDPSSTGIVSWGDPVDRIVAPLVDDGGTPDDPSDDFAPEYVGGDDDGDLFLDPGEVWVFRAMGQRTATEGETYRNVAVVPDGNVHYGDHPDIVNTDDRTTPREDPAGYQVPETSTLFRTVGSEGEAGHWANGSELAVDVVTVTNLQPGAEYQAAAEIQVHGADGVCVASDATAQANGVADETGLLVLEVGPFELDEFGGERIVPYETILLVEDGEPGREVASHRDCDDESQTIRVIEFSSEVANLTMVDGGTQSDTVFLSGSTGGLPGGVEAHLVGGLYRHEESVRFDRTCAEANLFAPVAMVVTGSGEYTTPGETVPGGTFYGSYDFALMVEFADGSSWSSDTHGCTVLEETFTSVPGRSLSGGAPPVTTVPTPPPARELSGRIATTGSDATSLIVGGGALLLAAGVALVLLASARRRRDEGALQLQG